MKPRERVIAAASHHEPDRVPIDFGGTICTTISATANRKLKEFLNISKEGEIITHPLMDVILPLEEITSLYGTDCRTVRMKAPIEKDAENYSEKVGFSAISLADKPGGHELTDEYGTTWRKAHGYDYAPVKYPFQNATLSDIKAFKAFPDPYNKGRIQGLQREAKYLHENTDYAVIADIMCGGPFEQCLWLRGFAEFFMDLLSNQAFAEYLLRKITEIDIGMWDAQLSQVGEYVDIVCQGDDLGMQTGLQISPETYRKFIKPCHKDLFSFIRSKTKAKIWMHSCGAISEIIPDLIEVGVEIINPVQTGARNMELKKIKKNFGRDITFWGGGIDVQKLPFLTPSEIRENVREAVSIMAPGGGFVFAATHNILPETPGENTNAVFMAAKEFATM
ncbi:MAG: uroporphyrinogen decarboxylase family protein [Candidatus Humimicrobiaceae bacterium]